MLLGKNVSHDLLAVQLTQGGNTSGNALPEATSEVYIYKVQARGRIDLGETRVGVSF